MIRNRTELAVIVMAIILIGSLLAIGVSRARLAARKLSSQNNLKQIGLAVHNFESSHRRLPSGCDKNENHGWLTFIFPYIESSSWYSRIDRDIGWDHPLNHYHFTISIAAYTLPDQELIFTQEGFGITSYQGNPALLHKGSDIRFSDLTAGLASVWLTGEICGEQKPFGYPYNWRELMQPFNSSTASFGGWPDGAHFLIADGSVKFISNSIDPESLLQFAVAAPLPERSLYKAPDRQFTFTDNQPNHCVRFTGTEERPMKGGPPFSQVWLDANNSPKFIDFESGLIEVEQVLSQYSNARTLRIPYPRDAQELELICSLKNLAMLALMNEFEYPYEPKSARIEVSELLSGLKQLPELSYLKIQANDSDLALIRKGLPTCTVVLSSDSAPRIFWRR